MGVNENMFRVGDRVRILYFDSPSYSVYTIKEINKNACKLNQRYLGFFWWNYQDLMYVSSSLCVKERLVWE